MIVWSGEGVPQQRCHFQQAEVWFQGALSHSEGATATCVPTSNVQTNPQRQLSHPYLQCNNLNVRGGRPTSGVICLMSEPKSVNDALTNQEQVDTMKAEIDSFHNSVWEHLQLSDQLYLRVHLVLDSSTWTTVWGDICSFWVDRLAISKKTLRLF